MNNYENSRESEFNGGEEDIYSKSVRAGRRTYFFDVKATRNNDYFLTITESRKKLGKDGNYFFDKHKIYLYKEDFAKFAEGLEEVVDYIKTTKPELFMLPESEEGGLVPSLEEEFDRL